MNVVENRNLTRKPKAAFMERMPPALGYIVSVLCYTTFMAAIPPALGYIVSVLCYTTFIERMPPALGYIVTRDTDNIT
jgi:hypothetical protein